MPHLRIYGYFKWLIFFLIYDIYRYNYYKNEFFFKNIIIKYK